MSTTNDVHDPPEQAIDASHLELRLTATHEADRKQQNEHEEALSEEDRPMQKTSVAVDVNAIMQDSRFHKGDLVHMSTVENGVRDRGVFKIHSARYSKAKQAVLFQLLDERTSTLHQAGKWYREGVLRMQQPA